jgi:hypothetical protein
MRALRCAVPIAAALAAALVVPALAGAVPTLTSDRQCYAAGHDPMTLGGTGFTPGGQVTLMFAANGRIGDFTATADAGGVFSATLRAPTLESFNADPPRLTLSVTANDQARMAPGAPPVPPEETFAYGQVTLSDWAVRVAPWETRGAAPGRPRHVVKVKAIGWTSLGDKLYAHYTRGGRLVKTVKLGLLAGPCGDLTVRTREFPFRPVRPGSYRVQFDTTQAYSRNDASWFYRKVVVAPGDAVR